MNVEIASLIDRLEAEGWAVKRSPTGSFPSSIMDRYKWVPASVIDFASTISLAVSADEKVWLLTAKDYSGESDSAFAWNEWERMSLDAAEGDEKWISRIQNFWDAHMPLALSVADGYAYYALRQDLRVVYGCEPEFENVSLFSETFEEFLRLIASVQRPK